MASLARAGALRANILSHFVKTIDKVGRTLRRFVRPSRAGRARTRRRRLLRRRGCVDRCHIALARGPLRSRSRPRGGRRALFRSYIAASARRSRSRPDLPSSDTWPARRCRRRARPSHRPWMGEVRHRLAGAVAHDRRLGRIGVGHEDDELVATVACDDVAAAHRARRALAMARRTRSPAWWPCSSLTRLKSSRSIISTLSGEPERAARAVSWRRRSWRWRWL